DRPTDYRFLEVSPSFESQTGIRDGAGRWMREIAPDQDEFWFETYGRVARTGEPARFESHSTPLGRWWAVYAFRIQDPRLRRVGARPVDGDRTRLAQVLTNLLTNAAKYTPDGGRIDLTAGREGAEVLVRVADTGVGIPADMLPRVFDLFTQVARESDRSQGGL